MNPLKIGGADIQKDTHVHVPEDLSIQVLNECIF